MILTDNAEMQEVTRLAEKARLARNLTDSCREKIEKDRLELEMPTTVDWVDLPLPFQERIIKAETKLSDIAKELGAFSYVNKKEPRILDEKYSLLEDGDMRFRCSMFAKAVCDLENKVKKSEIYSLDTESGKSLNLIQKEIDEVAGESGSIMKILQNAAVQMGSFVPNKELLSSYAKSVLEENDIDVISLGTAVVPLDFGNGAEADRPCVAFLENTEEGNALFFAAEDKEGKMAIFDIQGKEMNEQELEAER